MTNANSNIRPAGSLLAQVRAGTGAAKPEEAAPTNIATRRAPSDFWLNVGITLKGAGKDGEDLFISLPVGLALDDMKPVQIKGGNEDWIHLNQTKNQLLAELQAAAASMEPGARIPLEMLSVELFRRNDPAQVGDAGSNPLLGGLFAALGKNAG